MFSHVMVGANDLPRQIAFYDAVLAPLGLARWHTNLEGSDTDRAGAGWTRPGERWPQFWVQVPFDLKPASVGNGVQVSFMAPDRAAVDAAYAAALAAGGADEGAPGERPHYAAGYYGAYCRDPEGNKIHFVHSPNFDEA
ncbi:VOC family protein [Salinarimonas rosea]|uniref:VOC family protein n=1 Tax=Salinarimonas rosea TaxID=552063 RepID=UPI00048D43E3|nr:VOC family protein [Salinarimonas rosea]